MKYLYTIYFLLYVSTLSAQTIDSLYSVFRHTNGSERTATANQLFEEFYNLGLTDSLYQFSARNRHREIEALITYWMAEYAFDTEDYKAATIWAEEALPLCRESGDDILLSDCLNLLSASLQRRGDFGRALPWQEACYWIDKRLGDAERLSSSLNNQAALYLATEQPKTAEKYILEAIAIERTLNRPAILAIRLGMASDILLKSQRPKEALPYATEALALDRAGGRQIKTAIRQSQLAAVLSALQRDDEAQELLQEAVSVFERNGNIHSQAVCCNQLGNIALHKGRNAEAADYFHRSVRLCAQNGNRFIESKAQYGLWRALRTTDRSAALRHLELYTTLADTIFSEQTARQLSNFQAKYELAEKEHRIAIQQNEIQHRKNMLIVLIIIIILCIIALTVIGRLLVLRQRHNAMLQQTLKLKERLLALLPLHSNSAIHNEIETIAKEITVPQIHFTPRERTIIHLCCEGLQTKEIADRLGISQRTVDTHKTNIFRKTGINNTVELMRYAMQVGLIDTNQSSKTPTDT